MGHDRPSVAIGFPETPGTVYWYRLLGTVYWVFPKRLVPFTGGTTGHRSLSVFPKRLVPFTGVTLAPRVHASTKKTRKLFMAACRRFVDAFRRAAELLKQGHREVEFPLYSFPPGAPFVSEPHRAVVVT